MYHTSKYFSFLAFIDKIEGVLTVHKSTLHTGVIFIDVIVTD